jgi:hypothetical protein
MMPLALTASTKGDAERLPGSADDAHEVQLNCEFFIRENRFRRDAHQRESFSRGTKEL